MFLPFIQNCCKIALGVQFALASAFCMGQAAFQPLNSYQPTYQPPYNSGPTLGPGAFPSTAFPQPNYTAPAVNPYATAPGFRPSTAPQPIFPNLGSWFGGTAQPPNLNYGPTFPVNASPGSFNPYAGPAVPSNYPLTNLGQPAYPNSIYPNSNPNVLFPGTGSSAPLNAPWNLSNQPYNYNYNPTTNWSGANWNSWWSNTGNNFNYGTNQVIRLFQGPRLRHTWLPGTDSFNNKSDSSLETNDTDVSLVFAIPGFLGGARPLYIVPSYSQHLWEGPTKLGSDLPGSAFSGFLDSSWDTDPVQTLGLELGARVGVFSAFDAINSNSIRLQGKVMGRLRLTPTATARAGVFYLDRNKIKLLPGGGILWAPNPDTRFDIFFPEPKLSHYLATVGNSDMWWYLTGYYGGGAWTIKQVDGTNDEIDINDIRIMMGLEFGKSDQIRQGFRLGFVEGGYAFNRELLYRVRSTGNLELENSFVLRAGFAY